MDKVISKVKSYIPSRGWGIFWGSIGMVGGLTVYDKQSCKSLQESFKLKASAIATQKAVLVFLDPTGWSRFWFMEFVKPIFDAGAVDYQLIDPDHAAELIVDARNVIWNARDSHQNEKEAKAKRVSERKRAASWSSLWIRVPSLSVEEAVKEEKDLNDRVTKLFLPHIFKALYNRDVGIVAVGPSAWRHLLLGLEEGSLTTRKDETEVRQPRNPKNCLDPSIPYPDLGYVSSINNGGFFRFPLRVVGWMTRRFMAEKAGKEALMIIESQTRAFTQDDVLLGERDFVISEKKNAKDASADDLVNETWTDAAEQLEMVDQLVIKRLYIYQ